jgi:hypothetical protein
MSVEYTLTDADKKQLAECLEVMAALQAKGEEKPPLDELLLNAVTFGRVACNVTPGAFLLETAGTGRLSSNDSDENKMLNNAFRKASKHLDKANGVVVTKRAFRNHIRAAAHSSFVFFHDPFNTSKGDITNESTSIQPFLNYTLSELAKVTYKNSLKACLEWATQRKAEFEPPQPVDSTLANNKKSTTNKNSATMVNKKSTTTKTPSKPPPPDACTTTGRGKQVAATASSSEGTQTVKTAGRRRAGRRKKVAATPASSSNGGTPPATTRRRRGKLGKQVTAAAVSASSRDGNQPARGRRHGARGKQVAAASASSSDGETPPAKTAGRRRGRRRKQVAAAGSASSRDGNQPAETPGRRHGTRSKQVAASAPSSDGETPPANTAGRRRGRRRKQVAAASASNSEGETPPANTLGRRSGKQVVAAASSASKENVAVLDSFKIELDCFVDSMSADDRAIVWHLPWDKKLSLNNAGDMPSSPSATHEEEHVSDKELPLPGNVNGDEGQAAGYAVYEPALVCEPVDALQLLDDVRAGGIPEGATISNADGNENFAGLGSFKAEDISDAEMHAFLLDVFGAEEPEKGADESEEANIWKRHLDDLATDNASASESDSNRKLSKLVPLLEPGDRSYLEFLNIVGSPAPTSSTEGRILSTGMTCFGSPTRLAAVPVAGAPAPKEANAPASQDEVENQPPQPPSGHGRTYEPKGWLGGGSSSSTTQPSPSTRPSNGILATRKTALS